MSGFTIIKCPCGIMFAATHNPPLDDWYKEAIKYRKKGCKELEVNKLDMDTWGNCTCPNMDPNKKITDEVKENNPNQLSLFNE